MRRAIDCAVHANIAMAGAAVLLLLCRIPLMTVRWRVVLTQIGGEQSFLELFRIQLLANFYGIILPTANGADVVRGALAHRSDLSLRLVVTSIIGDRIVGVASMAFLAIPGALFLFSTSEARGISEPLLFASLLTSILGCASLCAIPYVLRQSKTRERNHLSALIQQCDYLRPYSIKAIIKCLIASLASQSLAILAAFCAGKAIAIEPGLPLYFVLVPITWLLTLFPLTLSGVGVREAGFAALFGAVGLSYEHGVALGALVSGTTVISSLLCGLGIILPPLRKKDLSAPRHLIIAGLPRTGTTSIYRNMEGHPGFTVPVRKELNHFLHENSPVKYGRYFSKPQPGAVCLDVSPFYSLVPGTALRIATSVPKAKVILIVREPAAWLHSVYVQTCSFIRHPPSFETFVTEPWMPYKGKKIAISMTAGVYEPIIREYASALGDKLLVIDFAELEHNPLAVLQRIERFAEVTPYFTADTIDPSPNNTSYQATRAIPYLRNLLSNEFVIITASSFLPSRLLRKIRASFYYRGKRSLPILAMTEHNWHIAAAATFRDLAYYKMFFANGPFRSGAFLKDLQDSLLDAGTKAADNHKTESQRPVR